MPTVEEHHIHVVTFFGLNRVWVDHLREQWKFEDGNLTTHCGCHMTDDGGVVYCDEMGYLDKVDSARNWLMTAEKELQDYYQTRERIRHLEESSHPYAE